MTHPQVVDPQHPLVARVRRICLAFPEANEIVSHGCPTFRAGKVFVTVGARMDRPFSIVVKPDAAERPALLSDPRFFVPPYFGPSGCLAIDIDPPDTDWEEIAELIDTSYRQIALKRQLAALDALSSTDDGVAGALV